MLLGGQKGEWHQMPRPMIDAAVGKDLAVRVELELTSNKSIGELSGLDSERADIAGNLFVVGSATLSKDDLEHAAAGFVGST